MVYHVVVVFETVHLALEVLQLPMLLQLVVLVAVVSYGHDEVVPEKHENSEHRVDAVVVASFAAGDGASFVAVADENTYFVELLKGFHLDGLDMVHELLVAEVVQHSLPPVRQLVVQKKLMVV